MFTIFSSDITGNATNCSYPHRCEVTDAQSLAAGVGHDYVCAEYANNYRNNDNFRSADCLPVDLDNDHSENPDDWFTPADIAAVFPGVAFAVHYSRHHRKEKDGKSARPRFHVLFPIDPVTNAEAYAQMKQRVLQFFPYFDHRALDAARFFFGTNEPQVELYPGEWNLTRFLESAEVWETESGLSAGTGSADTLKGVREPVPLTTLIPQGSRNSTLSVMAAKIIKRFGDTEEAHDAFLLQAERCDPPLEADELATIWRSAEKLYNRKILANPDYIPPEQYSAASAGESYEPSDYTDVGQAMVLARVFSKELRWSPNTKFLHYNSRYWEETESGAQAVAQELTRRQLEESAKRLQTAIATLIAVGGTIPAKGKKQQFKMSPAQEQALQEYKSAKAYHDYALERRMSKNITNTLKEVHPMVEISPHDLDSNEFYLCTPDFTVDLRQGMDGIRPHDPEDYITRMTGCTPGEQGADLWQAFLNTTFCGDAELIEFVQMLCGLASLGKVHMEALIIAYGSGRNGKSTFWNTIANVLGSYSGNFSADALTAGCRRNVKPEMAELRGKRLIIAAELQEGMRLNDSTVKQLASTDSIYAEPKYKDPFSFTPTHTLVLYTNHLPKVGTLDEGTWRRLMVVPFNAIIEGSADIKNYGEYLTVNAGPAVLAWVIEGARKVIAADYKPERPKCVQLAIAAYREANNWFQSFLDEKCEVDPSYQEKSGKIYMAYRNYCMDTHEYARSTTDFYSALENAGFHKVRRGNCKIVYGLKLRESDDITDNFLK